MAEKKRLTPYERFTVAVQAQVPLVRVMEAELGKERAHDLVRKARDDAARAATQRRAQRQKIDIPLLLADFDAYAEGIEFEYDIVEQTEGLLRANVKRCDYANYMEKIGARDLGPLLACDADFAFAEGMGATLERTKTLMKGDDHCNFCYRLNEATS